MLVNPTAPTITDTPLISAECSFLPSQPPGPPIAASFPRYHPKAHLVGHGPGRPNRLPQTSIARPDSSIRRHRPPPPRQVKLGKGSYFTHRGGHSIDIKAHESPYLNQRNNGMVSRLGVKFGSEAWVYFRETFGLRHEDALLVREYGEPEILSE
jgi:hypothetical protein